MRLAGVLLATVLVLGSTSRGGADETSARAHFRKGSALFAVERYDEAIAEFQAGFVEEQIPGFLFNIAQAHNKAGRPKPALDYYRRYLELAPEAKDREEVERQIAELEEKLRPPPPKKETPPPPAVTTPPKPAVTPPPLKVEKTGERTPLYRRWWLWTAVAGGAAVLAVGLGVGLGSGKHKLTVVTDLGTYRPY